MTSQASTFAGPARPHRRTIGTASSTTEDHQTCRGGAPFASDGRVAGDDGRAEATRTGVPEGGGGSARELGRRDDEGRGNDGKGTRRAGELEK